MSSHEMEYFVKAHLQWDGIHGEVSSRGSSGSPGAYPSPAAAAPRPRDRSRPAREGRRAGSRRPITLSKARSRLDRRRFSRPNTHFSAVFKICKKIIVSQAVYANFRKISAKFLRNFEQKFKRSSEIFQNLTRFCGIFTENLLSFTEVCKIL